MLCFTKLTCVPKILCCVSRIVCCVCRYGPPYSSDFLSRNCRNVGNSFAAGVPDSEGEGRLRLVWLVRVSEALPTVLSLKDNDASDSTFVPQFGQKANEASKPLPQFRQNMLERSKMASISDESAANNATRPQ